MHWADVIASRLDKTGGIHRIATGITQIGRASCRERVCHRV